MHHACGYDIVQDPVAFSSAVLQEVLSRATSARWHRPSVIRNRREDGEVWLQILTQCHNGCYIAAPVAVVRRGPYRDDVLIFEVVFVAFVDQLMGAGDEL